MENLYVGQGVGADEEGDDEEDEADGNVSCISDLDKVVRGNELKSRPDRYGGLSVSACVIDSTPTAPDSVQVVIS